jgi:hypothetical protein
MGRYVSGWIGLVTGQPVRKGGFFGRVWTPAAATFAISASCVGVGWWEYNYGKQLKMLRKNQGTNPQMFHRSIYATNFQTILKKAASK